VQGTPIVTNISVEFPRDAGYGSTRLTMEFSYQLPGSTTTFSRASVVYGAIPFDPKTNAQIILPLTFTLSGSGVSRDQTAKIELSDSLATPTYVALDSREKLLLLELSDNSVRVYGMTDGRAVSPDLHQTGPLVFTRFRPDNRAVATLCADATFGLWQLSSGKLIGSLREANRESLPGYPMDRPDVAFSADGRFVVLRIDVGRVVETPDGRNHAWSIEETAWRVYSASDMREVFVPSPLSLLGYGKTKSVGSRSTGGEGAIAIVPGANGGAPDFGGVFDAKSHQVLAPPLNHAGPVLDVRLRDVEPPSSRGTGG
jgi:WD40 repeat protein